MGFFKIAIYVIHTLLLMLDVVIAPRPSAAFAAALGGDPSGRAAAGAAALSVVAVAAAAVGKKRGASSSASSATASAKERPYKRGNTLSTKYHDKVKSIVHAYDKKCGFLLNLSSNDDDGTSRNDVRCKFVRSEHRREGATKRKSHPQIIERWAKFERFMLEYHPDCDYSKWLLSLRTETSSVIFMVRKRNAQLHSRHQGLT